jgi:8-oxo-dGTP pyrophosphatase MutT (NUDIX family)
MIYTELLYNHQNAQNAQNAVTEVSKELELPKLYVPRNRAGIVLFSTDRRSVLMVKPKIYEHEDPASAKWGFPKGSAEDNERMNQCASREFFEETGLYITIPNENPPNVYRGRCDVKVYYYLYIMTPSMENQFTTITRVYKGVYSKKEISEMRFIPLDQLKTMSENKELNSDTRNICKHIERYLRNAVSI